MVHVADRLLVLRANAMIGDRVSLRYQFLLGLRSNRTALFDRGWSADNKMSWQLPRGDKEEIFFFQ